MPLSPAAQDDAALQNSTGYLLDAFVSAGGLLAPRWGFEEFRGLPARSAIVDAEIVASDAPGPDFWRLFRRSKRAIVAEIDVTTGASVSEVARRHGIKPTVSLAT